MQVSALSLEFQEFMFFAERVMNELIFRNPFPPRKSLRTLLSRGFERRLSGQWMVGRLIYQCHSTEELPLIGVTGLCEDWS